MADKPSLFSPMKKFTFFLLSGFCAFNALAQTTTPTPDLQIKTAVLAAPSDKRDGATVLGYSGKNEMIVLRKGTNDYVCLADDPTQKGLNVSCYHQGLEPFMARGRELKKEGKSPAEIMKIRGGRRKSREVENAQTAVFPFRLFGSRLQLQCGNG